MPPAISTQRNGSSSVEDPDTFVSSADNAGLDVILADALAGVDARFDQYEREVQDIPQENLPPIDNPEDGERHLINVRHRVNNAERVVFQELREVPIPPFDDPRDRNRFKEKIKHTMRKVRSKSIQVLQAMAEIISAILKDPVKVSIFSGICAGLGVICEKSSYIILAEVVGPALIFTAVAASACFVLYKTTRFVIEMRAN